MRILLSLIISLSLIFPSHAAKRERLPHKPVVCVLSIDGGGVKGIVPTLLLKEIERRADVNHVTELFDVMAGTSTGALIAIMLNIPVLETGKPRYTLGNIQHFYEHLAEKVFTRSYYRYWTTFGGWTSAKYSAEELERQLKQFMNGTRMSQTIKHVLVPAFNLKNRRMKFFRTSQAQKYPEKNFLLRDVARATSAAPSYFEAARFTNIVNTSPGIYIDGGIGVNNPTISAMVYAAELYGKKQKFFVLSIGCGTAYDGLSDNVQEMKINIDSMGKIDWASHIVDILMDGANDVTHYQLQNFMSPTAYVRIQLHLPEDVMEMDDGSPENIAKLKKLTEIYIKENSRKLEKIAQALKWNYVQNMEAALRE